MRIIELNQEGPEWLSYRRGGIGASDVPAILGKVPYKTALDVYKEKVNFIETPVTPIMQRGKDYEAEARELFEKEIGFKYPPICVEHDEMPFCRASLDGFNAGFREVLEIKIPSPANFAKIANGEIPEHYKIQMYWQMFIAGAETGYLLVYYPETMQKELTLIKQDMDFINENLPKLKEFWKCVLDKTPPSKNQFKYTNIEDNTLEALLDMYQEYKSESAVLALKMQETKDEIIAMTQGESSLCGGYTIQKREVSRIDYKKACEDHGIDLDEYKKASTDSWVISCAK